MNPMPSLKTKMTAWSRQIRLQTMTVYFAARDARTPWAVRLLALLVAAYALSPIDLIPDFIPVLGLLDDLLIVPLGIALVVHLTPAEVMAEARHKAAGVVARPVSHAAAACIVLLWAGSIGWLAWVLYPQGA